MLTPDLLAILRCPACRAELAHDESAATLTCRGCGLIYPIRDGIPILLIDEAKPKKS